MVRKAVFEDLENAEKTIEKGNYKITAQEISMR